MRGSERWRERRGGEREIEGERKKEIERERGERKRDRLGEIVCISESKREKEKGGEINE